MPVRTSTTEQAVNGYYPYSPPSSNSFAVPPIGGVLMVHRSIDCSTWDDPWFAELAPKAKLLFLFLITNRRVTQCGAMEITVRQIQFETGLPSAEIPNLIESFGDRIHWWHEHSLLIVRNFYRHQRANTGDKFDIAARKSAETLPIFAREWVYGVYPHLRPAGDTPGIPTPLPQSTLAISEAEAEAEAEDGCVRSEPITDIRGSRLPDDFAVDDSMTTWAVGKGFSPPEIAHYTEAFTSYWRAESGARSRKKDWRQSWQVWLLKETPGKRPSLSGTNGKVDYADPVQREAWRKAEEAKMLRAL